MHQLRCHNPHSPPSSPPPSLPPRYTCRGLFERHKLLFAFHMCAKILEMANKINMDEYNFFLRGGVVLDRETQMDNPCKWLDDTLWDNITELDK